MKAKILIAVLFLQISIAYCVTKRYYKEVKLSVPVDHFSFSRNDSFQLRYLLNDTFWKADTGPVFFYTGNEGAIELFAAHTGFIWDIAEEFQALVVFAEHRYYGDSLPFGNKSFSAPQYTGFLTSSQALADYVEVINHLKTTLKFDKNPIVTFGGSYGGMLASYFRIKYPHLIAGAIAASAPVHQFTNMVPCDASSRIISSVFGESAASCRANIKRSWNAIRNLTKTDEGKAWLEKEWILCKPLKNESDISTLIDYLSTTYFTLAMMNYPYENDFMKSLPGQPVRVFCKNLRGDIVQDKPLLQSLYKGINMFANYTGGEKCLNTVDNYSPQLGDLAWDFQACTEMVLPACSTGVNDMFELQPWNETEYSDKCKAKWGVRPVFNLGYDEYGGDKLEAASNIVFSNGLLDPWAAGGILKNVSNTIRVVIIPEGAHHLDLMGANPSDPTSVRLARIFHKQWIKKWIM